MTGGDIAQIGRVAVEEPVEHGGAARIRQQVRLIADEAASRRMEEEPLAAGAGGAHVAQFGAPLGLARIKSCPSVRRLPVSLKAKYRIP